MEVMKSEKSCRNCLYFAYDCEPCENCRRAYDGGCDLPDNLTAVKDEPEAEQDKNAVNHPAHYNAGKIECIDAMQDVFGEEATKDFCLLNAFKYIWRCKDKGNEIEDIKKAIWYLNKYLELSEG